MVSLSQIHCFCPLAGPLTSWHTDSQRHQLSTNIQQYFLNKRKSPVMMVVCIVLEYYTSSVLQLRGLCRRISPCIHAPEKVLPLLSLFGLASPFPYDKMPWGTVLVLGYNPHNNPTRIVLSWTSCVAVSLILTNPSSTVWIFLPPCSSGVLHNLRPSIVG